MKRPINKLLGRVLIPLVTPFDNEFKVDYKKAAELTELVISRGYCDSIIVSGTTGEFHALNFEERVKLFKTVRRAIKGRVPLIAGTGAAYTGEAIALTKEAEKIGVEAVMIVAPYYCKPTQEGIFNHFRLIAKATSLPVILYNIPLFTGINIDPETVVRLVKTENVVAIKEEAGINPTQTTEYILSTPEDFVVYCGDDTMVLQVLSQGGVGVVSGGSHVIGDYMKGMIDSYFKGDVKEAKSIYLKIFPLFKAFNLNNRVNPIPLLKATISMTGIDVGKPRPPLIGATKEEEKKIKEVLRKLGKL